MIDDVIEALPDFFVVRFSHDDALLDAPALAVVAIPDDLVLQTVVLSVDAAGQSENAVRQLGGVFLAACHDGVLVLQISTILPELAQQRVIHDLQAFRIVPCFEEALSYCRPRHPRAGEGIEPEGAHPALVGVGVLCDPLGRLLSHDVLRC